MNLKAILQVDQARTAAIMMVCWVGFASLAWWVASGSSMTFDEAGLALWRKGTSGLPTSPGWLLPAMRGVTFFGNAPVRNTIAAVVGVALLVARYRREVVLLALTVSSGALMNSWMKILFGRARPHLVPWLDDASGFSYPSGHAFNATVVYLSIALVLRGSLNGRHSAAITAFALSFAAAIAFSRVWLGMHYPTDALAGWLGGIAWVLTIRLTGDIRLRARA